MSGRVLIAPHVSTGIVPKGRGPVRKREVESHVTIKRQRISKKMRMRAMEAPGGTLTF